MMRIKDIDQYELDNPKRTLQHRKIIRSKYFLRKLYTEWYAKIKTWCIDAPGGKIIELGSGGGFMKEIFHEIYRSDIMDLPDNDYTFDALNMPFRDKSIAAFVMIDVFHHVPDSYLFLKEMKRCLKPGGLIIMSEPCNTGWSKFIFKNFHHEPFDPDGDWTIPVIGPMSSANGALPWVVFERDSIKFKNEFPDLKIIRKEYHTPLAYLLSGGLTYRQLFPNKGYEFVRFLENCIQKILPKFALFQFIKLKYTS